ncbi:MAG: glycosyl transferase family 1 [Chlorobiaceae bacterium]|nr:glycosyl transferase family 1 [Chlorobiaceae bacterium]
MNKKKKIIIIGPAYPYRGGNPTFVTYVWEALSEKFDVKIFNYKLLYPSFLFPGTTQFDTSKEIFKKAPSERIINSINPFNWYKVAKRIKAENPDLLVFDWWHPFFSFCHFTISFLVKSKLRNKIMFITENFISHEGHFIDRTLTKFGLLNSDIFLALSKEVETSLNEIKGERKIYKSELPIFNYNKNVDDESINKLKQKFGYNSSHKILLFFGYVRKYKGLDLLIEAMPKILEFDKSIRLLVVGEFYDDPSTYQKLIDKFSLNDYIKIQNEFIPNEEISLYSKISDLFILPYKSATQSAILTVAYSAGKPVVATRVGGLEEFVDDEKTGIIVEPNSPEAIANGVVKYFGLSAKVNFEENIRNKISQNQFNELPELFETIIKNISLTENNRKVNV